jgi:hypothetical protein
VLAGIGGGAFVATSGHLVDPAALAAAYACIALQGAADRIVHSVGVLFDPVVFVLS